MLVDQSHAHLASKPTNKLKKKSNMVIWTDQCDKTLQDSKKVWTTDILETRKAKL